MKKFLSRKLFVLLLGVVATHLSTENPELAVKVDAVLGTAYILVQGLVDALHGKPEALVATIFKSTEPK